MARKLDSFVFPGRGGARYPWDEWLDGGPWELKRGVDFTVTVQNIRAVAYATATRRGVSVRTSSPDDETLVLQAYPSDNGARPS